MESKLKALKVADLRQLLSKAAVSAPQKANKNELISRVLSTPSALELYSAQYDKKSLSPQQPQPEDDVDQLTDDPVEDPPTVPEPEKLAEPPATATAPALAEAAPEPVADQDPEAAKRRQRAARFGIPLVEQTPNKKLAPPKGSAPKLAKAEDQAKLEARANRFGSSVSSNVAPQQSKRKRDAPAPEQVDPEELERRRKRAERFSIPAKS